MYHLSMRILTNHHDTEDVLIGAFIRVFNHIHHFEYQGDGSLTRWIKTIVINESIRFLNRKKQLVFYEDINEINNAYWDDTVSEAEIVDTERIYAILESMPAGYRMVFNLFAIEGYSHKEIAEMLNISENTSKTQLRKARLFMIERIQNIQKYG